MFIFFSSIIFAYSNLRKLSKKLKDDGGVGAKPP
jgi:hypothetical protein